MPRCTRQLHRTAGHPLRQRLPGRLAQGVSGIRSGLNHTQPTIAAMVFDGIQGLVSQVHHGRPLQRGWPHWGQRKSCETHRAGLEQLRAVAQHNDRHQFEMVLEQRIKDLLVDRQDKNGVLFDMYFANPGFQASFLRYLSGTYDEFRSEAVG